MVAAEEMKGYELALSNHTPCLDIPVTEVAVFKLREALTPDTLASIEKVFVGNSSAGRGVRRTGWGFSLDDPNTFIIMWDWDKIQDHWHFWQTPAFPPLMACIEKSFQDGLLVRHYKFEPAGMVKEDTTQILIWDAGKEATSEEIARSITSKGTSWKSIKTGPAVDMGDMTWCCAMLGYDSAEAARADNIQPKEVSHLVRFKYITKGE